MINLDTKAFADFKTVDKTNLSEFQGGGAKLLVERYMVVIQMMVSIVAMELEF